MAKTKTIKKQSRPVKDEYETVYFLKILLYFILGTIWLAPGSHRVVPVGVIVGLLLVQHEKLQIDRKIEYAILLIGGVLGMIGVGLTIKL